MNGTANVIGREGTVKFGKERIDSNVAQII